jgi:hypothetical protein
MSQSHQPDFDDYAPPRDKQFVSMWHVCQLLQILPGQLRVLMDDCRVKFAQVVDGVGYLLVADAEAIARKCGDVRKEIHDVLESAENN